MGFLGALISGGTSLLGGLFGSNAASKAAEQQAAAANNAANFAKNQQNQALGTINSNLTSELGLLSPYLQGGNQAMANLSSLVSAPGQGLLTPWTGQFQAPTAEQAAATPGYQFQVEQANKQAQNSAAARGGLLNGGTAKALAAYNQGLASENYNNVYNRSFNEYLQNYNQFLTNQNNMYSRLRDLSGVGLSAANSGLGAYNAATGQTVGTLMDTSRTVGQDLTNAGAAQASGTVGSANAWNGALSGIGNAALNYSLLRTLNTASPFAGYDMSPTFGSSLPPTGTPGIAGIPPGTGTYMPLSGLSGVFNQSGYGP